MTSAQADDLIKKIEDLLDEFTLLGAAWDCMSDNAKTRFKKALRHMLTEVQD